MNGIETALTGRLGRAPELRETKTGKAMAVLNVAVDEGGEVTSWVKVLAFEAAAEAVRDLEPGAEIYAEGRLKLDTWTSREGEPRASLTVLARLVQPLGRIGRRRPRGTARGAPAGSRQSGAEAAERRHATVVGQASAGDDDGMPFDDDIPF